ncbi:DUF305 domain-containing protein [Nannocystis punicea]|uniref:DUF305 domain-containing protein n=1 Tax=Nannocystis punicea TaxID=2995304 RepID=A0ABY7H8A9_9BACT|nr:DUF305 domain-containing protein [Nannocystis poenicansa]WAS95502.1 DUF305 domain-containing protein [Nannocystis poenicansa]
MSFHTLRLLALGAILACDTGEHDECMESPESDVEFIDAMVPHHQAAIEMADMELERGDSPAVKAVARMIKEAQAPEISQMRAIRAQLTGYDIVPERHDPHSMADMEKLMALSGPALDRGFLEAMIPHHADAITMSHQSLPYLRRAELRTMADQIVLTQAREIGEFVAMLTM